MEGDRNEFLKDADQPRATSILRGLHLRGPHFLLSCHSPQSLRTALYTLYPRPSTGSHVRFSPCMSSSTPEVSAPHTQNCCCSPMNTNLHGNRTLSEPSIVLWKLLLSLALRYQLSSWSCVALPKRSTRRDKLPRLNAISFH